MTTYRIVGENDQVLDGLYDELTGLTQEEAEHKLCRALNNDAEAWIMEEHKKPFLVHLNLRIGEYEKGNTKLYMAMDKHEAGYMALTGECHDTPDFSDYPDMSACWDMGEMIYEVAGVKELTEAEGQFFKTLTNFF